LIETINSRFEIEFSLSSGRIQPFVGERLHSKARNIQIIERKTGSDSASFYTEGASAMAHIPLKEPEKLALTRFVSFDSENFEAKEVDDLLRHTASYVSRQFALFDLRRRGSESNYHTHLWVRAQNLWSVLRNIHDKRSVDDRYETILDFMRKAFPAFEELVFDQSGPNSVYCEFKERHHNRTIKASGVSDGHLQFLILLTSLFSDGKEKDSLILFDEPETSLHPHALAILAEAMKKASSEWSKQIFVATHSPVLMSQFEPEDVWAVELDEEGRTILERVSAIEGVRDLLDKYGVGVLYMAESIAPQSKQIQTATVG
jgi:predicted ATPase